MREQTPADLIDSYSKKTDGELLAIALDTNSLTEAARQVLDAELSRRQLGQQAIETFRRVQRREGQRDKILHSPNAARAFVGGTLLPLIAGMVSFIGALYLAIYLRIQFHQAIIVSGIVAATSALACGIWLVTRVRRKIKRRRM
jgi:hypothetical protein